MPNSNLQQLIAAASLLLPMLDDLVFLGGSVTGLLITDEAAGDPRATRDVDAIAAIQSYAAYAVFGERLRSLGFSEDTSEDAPLADGFIGRSCSMLCHSMKRFSDFPTAGIGQQLSPRSCDALTRIWW